MRVLLFLILTLLSAPVLAMDRESQEMFDAILRYSFLHPPVPPAKVYFVAAKFVPPHTYLDPTTEFIRRFTGDGPRVAKVSESNQTQNFEAPVRDKRTGEPGVLVTWIWDPVPLAEGEVRMLINFKEHDDISGFHFYLKKIDGRWLVLKVKPYDLIF